MGDENSDAQPAVDQTDINNLSPLFAEMRSIVDAHNRWRLARVVVICAGTLIGLWMVLGFLRDALELGPWPVFIGIGISFIGPSIVIWRIKARFRHYIKVDNDRIRRLELEIDARRESSGLTQSGQVPEDEV